MAGGLDRQPRLEGEHVLLRPLGEDDWTALFAIASDPQIWAKHPAHDRWQEAVFRGFFDEALASGGAMAVIDKESGALIGSTRFAEPDPEHPDEIEIGWSFLAREHWGTGRNGEAKRLMLGHALAHYPRAIFQVGIDNVISRKAMANIGGELTDRRRLFERGGVVVEHVIYAITREGFASGPLASG